MKKHSTIFSLIFGLWSLCLLYFNPRLLALLIGPESIPAKIFLFIFILILDIFWFYVFFHLVVVSFSYLLFTQNQDQNNAKVQILPKVALLYTTCNDFQEEAALTHTKQDYLNYHLFILDDSSSFNYRRKVDEFAEMFPFKVTVIRRENKSGFKAGNLNYALRSMVCDYEYFSVSDSDSRLPENYIKALLPYVLNSKIAFAQSTQISNAKPQTPFAQFMRINTDIHFRHYASVKNRYGFVMWYGHGALMRRDVWEQLGGFPEIATEDLAFSMKVRQAGFEGVFVENVVCAEDFPPTYKQYRKRNEKWIRGTAECLFKFYPSFVKTKHIPWFEKADVLVSGISLLLDLPFVFFLFLVGIALPFFFSQFQFQGAMFKMPMLEGKTPLAILAQLKSNLFYSWDVYILMLASIFAPLIPAIIDYIRQPKRLFKYLGAYIFCFFALQIISSINLAAFLFTRKSVFPVTGDQDNTEFKTQKSLSMREVFLHPHSNHKWVFLTETLLGICFCLIAFFTQNAWFLPVSFALCASFYLFKWNLNLKFTRVIIFVPFVITLGIVYFITKSLN